MQVIDLLTRAFVLRTELEKDIKDNPDLSAKFDLYRLARPGPGKDALLKSLWSSSDQFRLWFATGTAIDNMRCAI
jgi:hypothetical protein